MFRKLPLMTQEWENILFLHWSVSPEELQPFIPAPLKLDLYNQQAWISVVVFNVSENRVSHIPIVKSFLQLNVRTYVTYNGRKGVYFIKIFANHPKVVQLLSLQKFLPTQFANMQLQQKERVLNFRCHQNCKELLNVTFEPTNKNILKNRIDHWLVERYHFWTDVNQQLLRVDIQHSPWVLHKANGQFNLTLSPNLMENTINKQPFVHFAYNKKCEIFLPKIEIPLSR